MLLKAIAADEDEVPEDSTSPTASILYTPPSSTPITAVQLTKGHLHNGASGSARNKFSL